MGFAHQLKMELVLRDGVTEGEAMAALEPLVSYLDEDTRTTSVADGILSWDSSGEVSWDFGDLVEESVARLNGLVGCAGEVILHDDSTADRDAAVTEYEVGTPEMIAEARMVRIRGDAVVAIMALTGDSRVECESIVQEIDGSPTDVCREGSYSGKVLSIEDGILTQRIGRNNETTRHRVAALVGDVAVGEVVNIAYANGVGVVGGREKAALER